MSSIQEAIYRDQRKGKGHMPNFIALTNKQEKQGGTTNDDFHERIQERRMEERRRREAEGGIGGGYNDRQNFQVAAKPAEVADGFDDFGRRKTPVAGSTSASSSKKTKAELALERLRQNAMKGMARRDRSRSPGR
mmetsp:Transcript_44210/g.127746  ORF Transcript_44210/g.127746 Transcript_44210/m.127746 type:complete len:135 (+) Transcript_44210:196-600(+)